MLNRRNAHDPLATAAASQVPPALRNAGNHESLDVRSPHSGLAMIAVTVSMARTALLVMASSTSLFGPSPVKDRAQL